MLDAVDRTLIHALELDGRAPFSRIAEVLGTSESTVARRYRRLRLKGQCRIVGVPDVRRTGQPTWLIRVRCSPGAADRIGRALADAPGAAWVQAVSATTEVWCSIRSSPGDRHNLALMRRLGHAPGVAAVDAAQILRVVVGGPTSFSIASLPSGAAPLTAAQQDRLVDRTYGPPWTSPPPPAAIDEPLLAALAIDGRTSYADLARTCSVSETAVRRRLEALRRAGVVFFEQETDFTALGLETTAMLWITARPSRVRAIADALAAHPAVGFAAVTTGRTNLAAHVLCSDVDALHTFVVDDLGQLDGVERVDAVPVAATFKREGTVARGHRGA
ncbi:AsnC family transcriptional regulator [Streptomyces sp. SID3343]|nr:AsnC family transcriptional regulator [Streptomyces sp. SID3343]MYV99625.1 AsnC family transcriptional regulator [Streptomyces sp. SID3343]